VAQVVEYLPSNLEAQALSSDPVLRKKTPKTQKILWEVYFVE
jgi:hypothetical protein